MYTATDISPFVKQSQDTADFITGIRQVYTAARRILSGALGYIVVQMVMPFTVLFVWGLLWRQRRKLQQLQPVDVLTSASDYKKIRTEYDLLVLICNKIGDKNPDWAQYNAPFYAKGTLRLILDILNLIRHRKDSIEKHLLQLDAKAPVTDLLRPVPEAELWANRTSAYAFRF